MVESAVLLAVVLLCSSQYSRRSPHLVFPFKNCFRSAAVIWGNLLGSSSTLVDAKDGEWSTTITCLSSSKLTHKPSGKNTNMEAIILFSSGKKIEKIEIQTIA